jgi:hypothetical protein
MRHIGPKSARFYRVREGDFSEPHFASLTLGFAEKEIQLVRTINCVILGNLASLTAIKSDVSRASVAHFQAGIRPDAKATGRVQAISGATASLILTF